MEITMRLFLFTLVFWLLASTAQADLIFPDDWNRRPARPWRPPVAEPSAPAIDETPPDIVDDDDSDEHDEIPIGVELVVVALFAVGVVIIANRRDKRLADA